MSILIGCHQEYKNAFETNLGHQLDTLRWFAAAETNFNGGNWAGARNAAIAGYEVCVSFTAGSFASIPGGSQNSRIDAVKAWMLTVPPPPDPLPSGRHSIGHQLVFAHEMDNGSESSSSFQAACAYIYTRIGVTPGWVFEIIMTGGYRNNPFNNRDPDDWWPTSGPQVAILGADYYNQRGAQTSQGDVFADPGTPDRPQSDMQFMIDKAAGHGALLSFPEYASSIEDPAINPTGWQKRRDWIQSGANLWRESDDIYSITYYERDQLDPVGGGGVRINWRLSGGFLPPEPQSGAAFWSWGLGAEATPPPAVSSPQVIASTTAINSTTDGTVFTSATPFSVGPNELILLWLEADAGIDPQFPTFTFPTVAAGVAPTFTRIPTADNQWQSGATRSKQSLWVATTRDTGAASGLVLRATFGSTHTGCTAIVERVVGADISGSVAAAVASVRTAAGTATSVRTSMPTPTNQRNRTFEMISHALNEPVTPIPSAASTVAFRGIRTQVVGGVGGTITFPTGTVAGDTLLVYGATPTSLTGWTDLTKSGHSVFHRIAQAGESSFTSFTYVPGGSQDYVMTLVAYSGSDSHSDSYYAVGGGANVPIVIPGSMVVRFSYYFATAPFDKLNPAGYTERADHQYFDGVFWWQYQTVERSVPTFGTDVVTYPSGTQESLSIVLVPASPMTEGVDVTRTTPSIGVETAHSVDAPVGVPGATWATSSLYGQIAAEISAGQSAPGVKLGSTTNFISTMEAMLARSVDSRRIYVADSGALVQWGAGGWLQVPTADAAGATVFVSCYFGTNTWAQIVAGNANTIIDSIATNLANLSRPGVFCYFPEPELATGRGTSAQWRAAASYVINRMRPNMPGWRFANCLRDETWFGQQPFVGGPYYLSHGRNPADWLVPEADTMAVNAFNYKGATYPAHPYANPLAATYPDMQIPLWAGSWLSTAAVYGKLVMLSEFGCAVDDPALNANGHTFRASWIASAMTYMRGRVDTVYYKDLDANNATQNWRITGGVKLAEADSVAAFKSGALLVSIQRTHQTSAIIKKAATLTQTATAIVRKSLTRTQTADTILKPTTARTHTSDAIITKSAVLKTHTSDAYITPYVLVTHVVSATDQDVTSVSVG